MKIMLDLSPKRIQELSVKYEHDFWQLRTPLTRHALSGRPYGLDNGCFARFEKRTWCRLLEDAEKHRPVFVCLPDIVGDARRTLDLFDAFDRKVNGLPKALVLQDGIESWPIPWDRLSAVFVGGTDKFKASRAALNVCKAAKYLDKWVHVGRVNTFERASFWLEYADSIDGSGICKYSHMLEQVLDAVKGTHRQATLF